VSFGITEAEPGEELEAVLRRADEALMKAKRQGRDRVVLHDAVRAITPVSDDTPADLIPLLDEEFLPAD
jgi:predicted signal transduction protein with EAL and GGDEF domain